MDKSRIQSGEGLEGGKSMGEGRSFWLHDNTTRRSSYLRYGDQKYLAGLNSIRNPELLRSVCMAKSTLSFTENVIEEAARRVEVINAILVKATRGFLLPIFVATDGGQKSDEVKGNNKAVAAAVICMPDIRGMSDEQVGELSVEALLELKLIPVIA